MCPEGMELLAFFHDNECTAIADSQKYLVGGKVMKRRILSIVISFVMVLSLFMILDSKEIPATTVYAENELSQGVTINEEYLIPDSIGWCTYYVIVATNNTGSDISISADFLAKDRSGNILKKVNDYSEAVKKDQQFILYGQFLNEEVKKASSYEYNYTVAPTDKCAYTSVSLDTKNIGRCVEVSATNYSKFDIQSVGVRTVFMKNGKAVAFDTVNIADSGITFHGGSTNSQIIGYDAGDYDNYVLTYTSVGTQASAEDL